MLHITFKYLFRDLGFLISDIYTDFFLSFTNKDPYCLTGMPMKRNICIYKSDLFTSKILLNVEA